jgi:hypothetical protein
MPANTWTDKSSTYHRERRKTERKEGKKKAIVDVVRKQGIWSPFTQQQKKRVFFAYSCFVFRTLQGFLAIVYRNLAEYHVFSFTSGMSQSGTADFR